MTQLYLIYADNTDDTTEYSITFKLGAQHILRYTTQSNFTNVKYPLYPAL